MFLIKFTIHCYWFCIIPGFAFVCLKKKTWPAIQTEIPFPKTLCKVWLELCGSSREEVKIVKNLFTEGQTPTNKIWTEKKIWTLRFPDVPGVQKVYLQDFQFQVYRIPNPSAFQHHKAIHWFVSWNFQTVPDFSRPQLDIPSFLQRHSENTMLN